MRVARAYLKEKGLLTVSLNQDIPSLDSVKFEDNERILNKEIDKEDNDKIVGISRFRIGKILFMEDGTYSGIIFASTHKFHGKWDIE